MCVIIKNAFTVYRVFQKKVYQNKHFYVMQQNLLNRIDCLNPLRIGPIKK